MHNNLHLESDHNQNINDKKPINRERVTRNIQRIRESLLREGIFSSKMLEVFNLKNEQNLFAKHRFKIMATGYKTIADDNYSEDFEEEHARHSDHMVMSQ